MTDFYKTLNLQGSSIGNHEFDFGPAFLDNYLATKGSPSLAANLLSETGETSFLPNTKETEIYDLDGIKLGVIGLSTLETPQSTSGFSSSDPEIRFPDYQFIDYKDVVIKKAQELRDRGANAVVIVSHVGNRCPQNSTYDVRTNETEQEACDPDDEIIKLLDSLPEGTVDGVVEGHRH